MGTAEHIRTLRLRAGRTEEELADALGLTVQGYRNVEQHDAEFESTLSIAQSLTLARLLSADVVELLGESKPTTPANIPAIRAVMRAQLGDSEETREALEDALDWDLRPFLDGGEGWTTVYTLEFVRGLASVMGLDWNHVLAGVESGG
jgi:transcriptional regulator with XRE-family HTH domain